MFKNLLLHLPPKYNKSDTFAIEGLFDALTKLVGGAEKKRNPDDLKHLYDDTRTVIAAITRTYGNKEWLASVGVVTPREISGTAIYDYLECGGKIPHPIKPAIDRHEQAATAILAKWKVKVEQYSKLTHGIFENCKQYKTNEERAQYLIKAFKDVPHLNILNGTSLSGLMGSYTVSDYGLLDIGGNSNGAPKVNSLSEEEIITISGIVCSLLHNWSDMYAKYEVPLITDSEIENYSADAKSVNGLWKHIEKDEHLKEHVDLIGLLNNFLHNYYTVVESSLMIARALERWMHRSVK